MSAEAFILSFTPNKTCVRKCANQDQENEALICGNKLKVIPVEFGSERYCIECLKREDVQEQLKTEKGDCCSNFKCSNLIRRNIENRELRYGESIYCYICFHTLDLQTKLFRDNEKLCSVPIVTSEPKNWLNTPIFTYSDLQNFLSDERTKRYTGNLHEDIPNHLRYIIEVLLNSVPETESDILVWYHAINPKILPVAKDQHVLNGLFRYIYDSAMQELIKKVKWLLIRQKDEKLETAKQCLIQKLKHKRSCHLSEKTFYSISTKLDKRKHLIKKFLNEQSRYNSKIYDEINFREMSHQYLKWLENKGKRKIYDIYEYVDKDMMKYIHKSDIPKLDDEEDNEY